MKPLHIFAGILPSAHAGCFPQKCCGTSESAVLPFLSFEPRRTYPALFDLALYRLFIVVRFCLRNALFGACLMARAGGKRKHGAKRHMHMIMRFIVFLLSVFYLLFISVMRHKLLHLKSRTSSCPALRYERILISVSLSKSELYSCRKRRSIPHRHVYHGGRQSGR